MHISDPSPCDLCSAAVRNGEIKRQVIERMMNDERALGKSVDHPKSKNFDKQMTKCNCVSKTMRVTVSRFLVGVLRESP